MPTHRRSRPVALVMVLWLTLTASLSLTTVPARGALEVISVVIINDTDQRIEMHAQVVGCFNAGGAGPHFVDPGLAIHFATQDCDLSIDTALRIDYEMETTGGRGSFYYSNPFIGSDTFSEDPPEGYAVTSSGIVENRRATLRCDSACDGIPRAWKENGVTIDPGNGLAPQFVDLPRMGVSLDRPNVLVHMDRMVDSTRDQALRQTAIDAVIRSYDQSPVTYRGATRPGITLIVDAGPDSTITPGGAKWDTLSRSMAVPWSKYLVAFTGPDQYNTQALLDLVRTNLVPTGRLPIFHYSIAGAFLAQDTTTTPPTDDDTSGLALGDNLGFAVTLAGGVGAVGSQAQQTGTFMHELGHVLGLPHGGEDGVNYKPNYPSVMNYSWQMTGVLRNGVFVYDYSRDTTPDLGEAGLTENGGVGLGANASGSGTTYRCGGTSFRQAALRPVDFNCNSTTPDGGTGFDVNDDGMQTVLDGPTADWSRLNFLTGAIGRGSNAKDLVTIPTTGVAPANQELTITESQQMVTLPLTSTLTYTGDAAADYHDTATVKATLVVGSAPVTGRQVTFRIGSSASDTCIATTTSSGLASCTITISQAPASTTVTSTFGGDTIYTASSDSDPFTVTRQETILTLTSPTAILAGSGAATVSARLLEQTGIAPHPSGQQVTFTLGSQSCTGTADTTGVVSCSIVSVPAANLGPASLQASFAGDTFYEPSSATAEVIVFAFPDKGAFVVSSTAANATPNTLTWWSSVWTTSNQQTAGNNSFKGFANVVTTLPTQTPVTQCGTTFRAHSGTSGQPPKRVPTYMGVLVSDSLSASSLDVTNGTFHRIIVVRTDKGYSFAAGHLGRGTKVADVCG